MGFVPSMCVFSFKGTAKGHTSDSGQVKTCITYPWHTLLRFPHLLCVHPFHFSSPLHNWIWHGGFFSNFFLFFCTLLVYSSAILKNVTNSSRNWIPFIISTYLFLVNNNLLSALWQELLHKHIVFMFFVDENLYF